ncbi:septal ring lytic transglycosylase RlpA family protein [Immundisolibacter sp.]|uniref:septal ring lytic transglycosylase RlpA family protein n=1 Tax=Immundisolibacter sp. TaxID=1934948 RepID=UPI00263992C7|nr:septal ring lytic transglycosylase RlpA family protein [Immundisolibacter sp.]MDD3650773.1 septal ring lytic transglycosylase RlpA family protein [Immundisolibacter sp.]
MNGGRAHPETGRACAWLALLLMALLAGCAGPGPRPAPDFRRDGPPLSAVDINAIPDAVPRAEPLCRPCLKPYEFEGVTYRPLASAAGYQARGIASWYGREFHGRPTANGERYDMLAMTAAHPILPIPSYARVTNLANGRSVVVRINDRGPFKRNRLIDLSYVAAAKLGLVGNGSGWVEVRAVLPGAPATPRLMVADDEPPSGAAVYLQVGAFGEAAAAQRLASRLRQEDLAPVSVQPAGHDGPLHRVRLGPLAPARLQTIVARLGALGLPSLRVPAP